MTKVRLFLHRKDASAALRVVQHLGIVELTNVEQTMPSGFEDTVTFLSRFDTAPRRLGGIIEGNRIFTTEKDLSDSLASFNPQKTVQRAMELKERISHMEERLKFLHEEALAISEWRAIEIPLNQRETARTIVFFLNGMEKDWNDLKCFLDEKKLLYEFSVASETKAVVVLLKDSREIIDSYITNSNLEIIHLPLFAQTPRGAFERLKKETDDARKELAQYERDARALSENLALLKRASDFTRWERTKEKIIAHVPATKEVLIFEGWCAQNMYATLRESLSEVSSLILLEQVEPRENEIPPILIKNPSFIRPFESITELYGLPSTRDLDPTLFLAGFFFLFFGLSLTDVGYGIILVLLTGSLLTFFNLATGTKKLVSLLFLGGISSVIIGFLFGGYFGIDVGRLPAWLQALQKFDPIADPLPVLYLALGLGLVQVMVGLVLKIVRDARMGELRDGLLDQVPWLALFISLAVFGGERFGLFVIPFATVWLVYVSLAAIVITQGRKEKGIIKKVFMGLIGLYGFVGYFSDILSYSRLLALGLATTALAFAVNLIAGIIGDMIPYVGFIFMYVVLIVGHGFNLLVNVLGAFIHSARLQFVEFFSKFITSTGRTFNAFRREGTYVVLK